MNRICCSLISILMLFVLSACSFVQKNEKTIYDVAKTLCEISAVNNRYWQRSKMPIEQWCEIQEYLEPYIEWVVKGQKGQAPQCKVD